MERGDTLPPFSTAATATPGETDSALESDLSERKGGSYSQEVLLGAPQRVVRQRKTGVHRSAPTAGELWMT